MNANFSRIITLLRKEKGLSQKKAAEDLQISQALLSHYEKGIRECGLSFVVKLSDYYGVSCDYLLGKTPDRSVAKITVEDIPDAGSFNEDKMFKGSVLPALNKKLIVNSINILYDLIQKCSNKDLVNEVSSYLMLSIYKIFRMIYSSNRKNPQGLFSVSEHTYRGLSSAAQCVVETNASCVIAGIESNDLKPLRDKQLINLSPEIISQEYPLFASSLFNLVQRAESKMVK